MVVISLPAISIWIELRGFSVTYKKCAALNAIQLQRKVLREGTRLHGELDIRRRLIELAPDIATNRQVYLYYTARLPCEARLSRFTSTNGTNIDPATEDILLSISMVNGIRIGGTMRFGSDGYLYLCIGDAGVLSGKAATLWIASV